MNETVITYSQENIWRVVTLVRKFILLLLHVILGFILTILFAGILRKTHHDPLYNKVIVWWLRSITHILNIKITQHGKISELPCLYVSNHLSWLDIPVLGTVCNPRFLAKSSLTHAPFLGWMAEKAGTLFIHRGKVDASGKSSALINEKLNEDQSVLLFPEGTRGDGITLGKFYPRLFQCVIDTQYQIQTICIQYSKDFLINNTVSSKGSSKKILSGLWHYLGQNQIDVDVYMFPLISTEGKTRDNLADQCKRLVQSKIQSN